MPFLTRRFMFNLQADRSMNSSKLENYRADFNGSEEARLNLAQLQLCPDTELKSITFSLETTGRLVGEEIYWLQIETLRNNQTVWRGEVGVFCDETQQVIRFAGNIPLSEAQLWSLQEPNLYDLRLSLYRGTRFLHRVETFFGLSRVVADNGQGFLVNNYGWEPAVEVPARFNNVA